MAKPNGNAVIGQSGGPTSVINQSLVGVVSRKSSKTGHIDKLLGARHGVRGIINDDFIPLNDVPDDLLERIAQTPAAALGSTRDKPDQAYCEKIFKSFDKNDVRYFFYIGGNDSADTARIVGELAAKDGHELQGLPHPQDDRQRPARPRPHARLRVGRQVRRRRDHGRQLRQPLAARHQGGRDHGPPRRLPHRRLGAGAGSMTKTART